MSKKSKNNVEKEIMIEAGASPEENMEFLIEVPLEQTIKTQPTYYPAKDGYVKIGSKNFHVPDTTESIVKDNDGLYYLVEKDSKEQILFDIQP